MLLFLTTVASEDTYLYIVTQKHMDDLIFFCAYETSLG